MPIIPTNTANITWDRTGNCHDDTEIVQPPETIAELKKITHRNIKTDATPLLLKTFTV